MEQKKEKVLNVKVSADLHKKLKVQSALEGLTIKDFLDKVLNEYIDSHKATVSN